MADRRGWFSKAVGLRGQPPAPGSVATLGLAAADAGAQHLSGLVSSIVSSLQKPIYSDTVVTTKTWTTSDGRLITETRTKGWTVPLGLPVLIVGACMIWEIGLSLAKAFGISKGGSASDFNDAAALLDPVAWITYSLATGNTGGVEKGIGAVVGGVPGLLAVIFGQKATKNSDGTTTVKLPPTFMASLSYLGTQGMAPAIAGITRLLGIAGVESPT